MRAAWYVARTETRRYRRTLVVLALIVGLAAGVSMTAAAGARRASTSYDRLREVNRASDVRVLSSAAAAPIPVEEIAALSEVKDVGELGLTIIRPVGTEFGPFDMLGMVALDEHGLVDVERPRIIRGRMFDEREPREVVVNRTFADAMGIDVGDSFELEAAAPAQFDAFRFEGGEAFASFDGARTTVRVVGVSHSHYDISDLARFPLVLFSRSFWDLYGDNTALGEHAVVIRLGPGHDAAAFAKASRHLLKRAGLSLDVVDEVSGPAEAIALVSAALWTLAAVAAVAGLVMVGQSVSRHMLARGGTDHVLRATGVTRSGTVAVATLSITPAVVAGVVLATCGAIVGSGFMPVGLAGTAEPNRGISVDGLVLGGGAIALVVGLLGWTTLVASAHAFSMAGAEPRSRAGFRLPDRVAAMGLPPSVALGVYAAFTRGRGRASVPARAAIAGSVVGMAGIVAAATFGASLTRLLDDPERHGQPFDAEAGIGGLSRREVLHDRLAADRDVDRVTLIGLTDARIEERDVELVAFEPVAGPVALTVIEGRLPAATDEVALGDIALRRLGVSIGDDVAAATLDGASTKLHVVGSVLSPNMDSGGHAAGAVVTTAALEGLQSTPAFWAFLIGLAGDADLDEVAARYKASGAVVRAPRTPIGIANFTEVDQFPALIAAVLALLAVLAVGHGLVTSVRRRRHEIALLRALGFVRRQVAITFFSQVTTQMLLGTVVGIPLGIALGRWGWQIVATDLGVARDPSLPVVIFGVVAVSAVAFANLVAVWPGRAAATSEPALALRTE